MGKILKSSFKAEDLSRQLKELVNPALGEPYNKVATRNVSKFRYDLLDPDFLVDLACFDRDASSLNGKFTPNEFAAEAIRALIDYQRGVSTALVEAADLCMIAFDCANAGKMFTASYFDAEQGFSRLSPQFLLELALIAHHGSSKYGDWNFTKTGLVGEMSPHNHAMGHLVEYQIGTVNDRGHPMNSHFCHAAFNCMMEYWHIVRGGRKPPDGTYGPQVLAKVSLAPAVKAAVSQRKEKAP